MKCQRTNIHLLIKDVVERFSVPLANRNLTAELQLSKHLPLIEVDPDQMVQVLVNILSNAIKYSNDGGTVVVESSVVDDQQIEITIADNGIGIPKSDLNNVFKRFYRVDKARSREMGGTGLGLAIAKEIIEAHFGTIWIESTVGQGTAVKMRIPIEQGRIVGDSL